MLLVKRYLGWVAMSPNGTTRTVSDVRSLVAIGGEADVARIALFGRD
jgi:hypothetical protein